MREGREARYIVRERGIDGDIEGGRERRRDGEAEREKEKERRQREGGVLDKKFVNASVLSTHIHI